MRLHMRHLHFMAHISEWGMDICARAMSMRSVCHNARVCERQGFGGLRPGDDVYQSNQTLTHIHSPLHCWVCLRTAPRTLFAASYMPELIYACLRARFGGLVWVSRSSGAGVWCAPNAPRINSCAACRASARACFAASMFAVARARSGAFQLMMYVAVAARRARVSGDIYV